ncbi:MAG: nuclear transport factor 2 family protein [Acidobacteriia bacterium]|nr:nuclear transport factor 2 family protein [Terriglobia bacterium]
MKPFRTAFVLLFFVLAGIPLLFAGASPQSAQPSQPDAAAQITTLLRDFLAAVPRSDPRVFDNFFADDVLYTRSAGVTITKSDIMKSLGAPAPSEPASTYDADDITIHPYTGMAILNFRLIQRTENAGKTELAYFRNTATFLKRNNRWQVVAWQATRVPADPAPKP